MTKQHFNSALQAYLTGGSLDWVSTPNIVVSLVRSYSFNAAHATVADVTGAGGVIHATQALTGRTAPLGNGVFDADDVTFPAVVSNPSAHGLLCHEDNAVPATDRVLFWIDEGVNIPVVPDGNDENIVWDSGSILMGKI